MKRKIQESNATKVKYDTKLRNTELSFDSDANMWGENAQPQIGRATELLNHKSVIACLTRFSVVDPKLSKYVTAEDNISKKYYSSLKAVASKSHDVTFMFLRSLMPLFHRPQKLDKFVLDREELENEYAKKVYKSLDNTVN